MKGEEEDENHDVDEEELAGGERKTTTRGEIKMRRTPSREKEGKGR